MLIDDIEYVMFRHPDPMAAGTFMTEFGLLPLPSEGKAVYLRSHGDAPFSYVTEPGEAAFVGMGFRVVDRAALIRLAQRFSTEVGACPHPGGGEYFVITDPEGRRLEFVHGAERLAPMPITSTPIAWNDAHARQRKGRFQRPVYGPAHVRRLGHLAVFSADAPAMIDWYRQQLGFVSSELVYQDSTDHVVASFMHLDKGAEWTDHHTLAIIQSKAPALEHISFECTDFDDLGMGHTYLKDQGRRHRWGIGRHMYGSQVFDYWYDPADFHVEHYVDGDLVNDTTATLTLPIGRDTMLQWGHMLVE